MQSSRTTDVVNICLPLERVACVCFACKCHLQCAGCRHILTLFWHAGHQSAHQIITFEASWSLLKPGGVFICEVGSADELFATALQLL